MKFSISLAVTTLAALASAAPQLGGLIPNLGKLGGQAAAPSVDYQHQFPLPPAGTTITQASASCGSHLELNCCNQANTEGDAYDTAEGILAGFLQGIGGGQSGLGLFDGCSKLNLPIPPLSGGLTDDLNKQCTQTAACCQDIHQTNNGLLAVGLPCVALGGFL